MRKEKPDHGHPRRRVQEQVHYARRWYCHYPRQLNKPCLIHHFGTNASVVVIVLGMILDTVTDLG
jgi:hypothetical protein